MTVGTGDSPSRTLRGWEPRTGVRGLWRRNTSLFYGIMIVGLITLVAVFSGQLAPYDPIEQDLTNILSPPGPEHLLGTDNYGRDVLSRIICATPVDVTVGVLSVVFPLFIGIVAGMVSGYYGGIIDSVLMRLVDVVVAFPFMVLIIAMIAVLGYGVTNVVVAITIASWIIYARIVRGQVLVAKELEYVMAAKVSGFSDLRIMTRHILPNVVTTVVLFGALDVALDILLFASLGFLGLGVQPPKPEWGAMIAEGRAFLVRAWWLSTFPGFAIVITGAGFTLLADGLADVLRTSTREA